MSNKLTLNFNRRKFIYIFKMTKLKVLNYSGKTFIWKNEKMS